MSTRSNCEIIRAFYDNLNLVNKVLRKCYQSIVINTLEELTIKVNTFIELERENTNLEGKLTSSGIPARHAFSQDIRNEKRKDMMAGVDVEGNKAPPEISEFFTPLNQQFLAMLIEMEEKDLAQ